MAWERLDEGRWVYSWGAEMRIELRRVYPTSVQFPEHHYAMRFAMREHQAHNGGAMVYACLIGCSPDAPLDPSLETRNQALRCASGHLRRLAGQLDYEVRRAEKKRAVAPPPAKVEVVAVPMRRLPG